MSVTFALEASGGQVAVTLQGRVGSGWRELGRAEALACDDLGARALGKVWARGRLGQLAAELRVAPDDQRAEFVRRMTGLALEHGLVSDLTSFLAVDSAQPVTDGGDPARVDVAVPVPAGVRYSATVPDAGAEPGG
jgi:Ca-activated chloride channel family protein